MANKNKIVFYSLSVLAVGLLAFFVVGIIKNSKKNDDGSDSPNSGDISSANDQIGSVTKSAPKIYKGGSVDNTQILKMGDTGINVYNLQQLLGVTMDGIFGVNTESALMQKTGKSQNSVLQTQACVQMGDC